MSIAITRSHFPVSDYDLASTLNSGQAFRWLRSDDGWEGMIGQRWVRLIQGPKGIQAEAVAPVEDWTWLRHYLQADVCIADIIATFPDDNPMRASVQACRGMRLLRQDPWECLASFILSSTKQIVQIRQICALLSERFGTVGCAPPGRDWARTFPSADRIASCHESDLRECKMGFRAPHLLGAAKAVAAGKLDLAGLGELPIEEARAQLCSLRGVGPKIADCVLLYAYGFPTAFPIDVWIAKALKQLYFPKRKPDPRKIRSFADSHFGPHSGYAQQYLFHYMRTRVGNRDRQKRDAARKAP